MVHDSAQFQVMLPLHGGGNLLSSQTWVVSAADWDVLPLAAASFAGLCRLSAGSTDPASLRSLRARCLAMP